MCTSKFRTGRLLKVLVWTIGPNSTHRPTYLTPKRLTLRDRHQDMHTRYALLALEALHRLRTVDVVLPLTSCVQTFGGKQTRGDPDLVLGHSMCVSDKRLANKHVRT